MKKFLFILIGLVVSLSSQADILNPNISQKNILTILVGSNANQIRTFSIHIDNNGKYYLGSSTKASFQSYDGLMDNSYLENFRYGVELRKHIYLKLDNDSIITLTCEKMLFEETEWHWSTYYDYKIISGNVISIFKLNNTNIEALKKHHVIKVRFEERLVWDITEQKSLEPISILLNHQLNNSYQIYNNYLQKKEQKQKEYQEQKLLKQDPLYNF